MKFILWLHRYLGVTIGLLMVLWCLSGFVMMYQPYPRATPAERLQGLSSFGPDGRRAPFLTALTGDAASGVFRVEMLAGVPVLRARGAVWRLDTGEALETVDEPAARAAAAAFAAAQGYEGTLAAPETIDFDQWSIQERRLGPLLRYRVDGPSDALIYVSSRSGEVVQEATGTERFWTWLGAIPHWLYPTILRQHSGAWFQIVIWTSAIGVFLTVTGLFVGVVKFRKRPNGSWSPYRKSWLWHHYTGLIFGVLTLTWVFSGLMTMGPFWSPRPFPELETLQGEIRGEDARALIQSAMARSDAADMVRIEGAPMRGGVFAMARYADGSARRIGLSGADAPLRESDVRAALAGSGDVFDGADVTLLARQDAYYYSLHGEVELPVWRIRTAEDDPRLVYISAASGQILRTFDGGERLDRWLRSGLHSLDFPGLRTRPVWDVVVLSLLAGVTLLCGIGVWLAWGRVRRDVRFLTRKRGSRDLPI